MLFGKEYTDLWKINIKSRDFTYCTYCIKRLDWREGNNLTEFGKLRLPNRILRVSYTRSYSILVYEYTWLKLHNNKFLIFFILKVTNFANYMTFYGRANNNTKFKNYFYVLLTLTILFRQLKWFNGLQKTQRNTWEN